MDGEYVVTGEDVCWAPPDMVRARQSQLSQIGSEKRKKKMLKISEWK